MQSIISFNLLNSKIAKFKIWSLTSLLQDCVADGGKFFVVPTFDVSWIVTDVTAAAGDDCMASYGTSELLSVFAFCMSEKEEEVKVSKNICNVFVTFLNNSLPFKILMFYILLMLFE